MSADWVGGSQFPVAEEAKLQREGGGPGWRRAVSTQEAAGSRGPGPGHQPGDMVGDMGFHNIYGWLWAR